MRPSLLLVALSLALAPLAAGCADDGGPTGVAPTIAELTLTPETVAAGEVVTLSGSMRFSDPDGDVSLLVTELTVGDGAAQPGPETPVAGAAGIVTGEVPFQLAIQVPSPGAVTVRVWLVDGEGHPSNALEAVITAE